MIDDDLFTCDTPLGTIFNEFNRLSGMDDNLFTYEVKIPKLSYSPSVEQQMDDLDYESLDVYERNMMSVRKCMLKRSDMAEEQAQTNMDLMAFSDSENEVLFSEEVAVLKREVACKDYEINVLKSEFEKVKQEKEGIEFKIEKFDNASKSLNKLLESQITDKSKKGLGYNVVPPPHPLIYNRPKKLDLSYSGLDEFKDPKFKSYGSEDKQVSKDTSSFVESSLNVDKETIFLDKKIEFVKPKNHEKPVKKSVRLIVNTIKGKGWTVNIAHPKSIVFSAKPMSHFSISAQSTENAVKASACWVWRPTKLDSASITLKKHNYIDARGRSKLWMLKAHDWEHSLSLDFKEFDGGYFGGGAHGGRISGKGTLKTDSLDFEDVYFVNELKFNLFSVSQMCDKKNYVLFTDTECLVLSPNFKLPDESQILLKIPRKDNMYSFDMKNIVPKEILTCLVAKATSDKSMLWHRRLGYINFKNINKLVKDNLVRGLPIKHFENDQTCVACLKGKQHRASCKSKRGRDTKVPQSGGPLKKVGDEAVHKELGDRMERAATTASSLEEIIDFLNANQIYYALTVNPTIYTSCIEQFWATTKAKTINGEHQLQSLVDKKKVIITKTSIRSDLYLQDAGGTDYLLTATIFEELARMGRKQRKKTEVTQDNTNHDDSVPIPSNDLPLSGEDIMQLTELMILSTNLQKQVLDLEKAKYAQAKEIAGLKKREDASKQGRSFEDIDKDAKLMKPRSDDVEIFDTDDLHGDEVIMDMTVGEKQEQSAKVDEREVSTGVEDSVAPKIPVTTAGEGVTATKIDKITTTSAPTTTIDEITLAQTLIEIKAAKPKVVTTAATTITTTRPKARGVVVQEPSEFRTTTSSPQASQPSKTKDKGKAIMIEPEVPLKKKDQVALDEEMERNLEA
ncbi:ribonuclease H-like domain-containing protein [Tanacetum coccineum]|uniref:Ribonuclease H-like domain-containing protein n=1 Tax=Tanacetum coccineum TaxID=301880 RepID=A0ABQ4X7P6_9ASTR